MQKNIIKSGPTINKKKKIIQLRSNHYDLILGKKVYIQKFNLSIVEEAQGGSKHMIDRYSKTAIEVFN